MPTYDYRCSRCGHEFEAFQSITASPLRKCPKCGRKSLERLIGSGAALIFRGSGFYCTDYRKGGPPASPTPKKQDSKEHSADSGGSSDGDAED